MAWVGPMRSLTRRQLDCNPRPTAIASKLPGINLPNTSGVHSNGSMNIEIANESLLAGVAPPIEGCSACAAPAHSIIYSSVADPLTFDHFELAACSECGLAFTIPRPAEMERYYPNKYRAYRPIVSRLLRAMYTSRVSKWAKMKPNGSSILEIGCGPGLMLDAFQRRGWRVMGIERNHDAAEVGRRGFGVEIVS